MIVGSQIKYWIFGIAGAIGAYLVLLVVSGSHVFALGATLVAGCIGAMLLGGIWDSIKSDEKAATYKKMARDEAARQEWQKVMSDGAKQLESPKNE